MCRLFGVIAREPIDASYYMKRAPQSLVAQSQMDRKRLQGDGWGLGWFSAGRPRVEKSPRPLYRDGAHVARAIRKAQGSVLVGHVRWASNPLRLPRKELIGPPHTQPFLWRSSSAKATADTRLARRSLGEGGWLFAHNGTLYIPREVQAHLGPWTKFVKGRNDSEVLFYWLLKTVVHGKDAGWAKRIRASLKGLDRIWQSCKTRYPIYRHPTHGLNWVLTNGKIFLAFCYVNAGGFDQSKAFCNSRQPYFQLQMKITPDGIVVASEPLTKESGWETFRHGQLLIATRRRSGLSVRKEQVI